MNSAAGPRSRGWISRAGSLGCTPQPGAQCRASRRRQRDRFKPWMSLHLAGRQAYTKQDDISAVVLWARKLLWHTKEEERINLTWEWRVRNIRLFLNCLEMARPTTFSGIK